MMHRDEDVREHSIDLLGARGAHTDLLATLEKLAFGDVGRKPEGAPHTLWELVEHIRIAQWDIVGFSRDPDHDSPPFPEGYWPSRPSPASEEEWKASLESARRDLESMKAPVSSPTTDLFREGSSRLRPDDPAGDDAGGGSRPLPPGANRMDDVDARAMGPRLQHPRRQVC